MTALQAPIGEMVETIWSSVLALPVTEADPSKATAHDGPTVAGIVQIAGAWDGAVALHLSERLARRATTAMMGIADADITRADLQDTLGELANMTGGNVKALLPEPCTLGLPVIVEGGAYRLRLPGSTQLLQCALQSDGDPFTVTVLQHVPSGLNTSGMP